MRLLIILMCCLESICVIQSYSLTMCFRHDYIESDICRRNFNSMSCPNDHVIMITSIRYETAEHGNKASCYECIKNISRSRWDINPVSFQSRVYDLCSQQDKCTIDDEFEIFYDKERTLWFATISYDCISTGMIHDICSPFEASINENDTLHFSLQRNDITSKNCRCVVQDSAGSSAITIIDYRPYNRDTARAVYGLFYHNGLPIYKCLKTLSNSDGRVFNTALNETSTKSVITLSKHKVIPKMLWFTVEGSGVLVQCNIERKVTNIPTSTETIMITINASFTSTLSPRGSANVFSESAVIGSIIGSVVSVIVIIVIILLCRRKLCSQQTPGNSEAVYYNEGLNNSGFREENKREKETKHTDSTIGKLSHDEGNDMDNVYLNGDIYNIPASIANDIVETSNKNIYNNENREYSEPESQYNALEPTNNEHVYSEIDREGNKGSYYNIAGI